MDAQMDEQTSTSSTFDAKDGTEPKYQNQEHESTEKEVETPQREGAYEFGGSISSKSKDEMSMLESFICPIVKEGKKLARVKEESKAHTDDQRRSHSKPR